MTTRISGPIRSLDGGVLALPGGITAPIVLAEGDNWNDQTAEGRYEPNSAGVHANAPFAGLPDYHVDVSHHGAEVQQVAQRGGVGRYRNTTNGRTAWEPWSPWITGDADPRGHRVAYADFDVNRGSDDDISGVMARRVDLGAGNRGWTLDADAGIQAEYSLSSSNVRLSIPDTPREVTVVGWRVEVISANNRSAGNAPGAVVYIPMSAPQGTYRLKSSQVDAGSGEYSLFLTIGGQSDKPDQGFGAIAAETTKYLEIDRYAIVSHTYGNYDSGATADADGNRWTNAATNVRVIVSEWKAGAGEKGDPGPEAVGTASPSLRGDLLAETAALPTSGVGTGKLTNVSWPTVNQPLVVGGTGGTNSWQANHVVIPESEQIPDSQVLGLECVAVVNDAEVDSIFMPWGGGGFSADITGSEAQTAPLKWSPTVKADVKMEVDIDAAYRGKGIFIDGDGYQFPANSKLRIYEWKLSASEGSLTEAQVQNIVRDQVPLGRIPAASPPANRVWGTDATGVPAWVAEQEQSDAYVMAITDIVNVRTGSTANILPTTGQSVSGHVLAIGSNNFRLSSGQYLLSFQGDIGVDQDRAAPDFKVSVTPTSGTAVVSVGTHEYHRMAGASGSTINSMTVIDVKNDTDVISAVVGLEPSARTESNQGGFDLTNLKLHIYRWGGRSIGESRVNPDWNQSDAEQTGYYIVNKPQHSFGNRLALDGAGLILRPDETIGGYASNPTYNAADVRAMNGRTVYFHHVITSHHITLSVPDRKTETCAFTVINASEQEMNVNCLQTRGSKTFALAPGNTRLDLFWVAGSDYWVGNISRPGALHQDGVDTRIDAKVPSWVRDNGPVPTSLLPTPAYGREERFAHMIIEPALRVTSARWYVETGWRSIYRASVNETAGQPTGVTGEYLEVPHQGNGRSHIGYITELVSDGSTGGSRNIPIAKNTWPLQPTIDGTSQFAGMEWEFKTSSERTANAHRLKLGFTPIEGLGGVYLATFRLNPAAAYFDTNLPNQRFRLDVYELYNG